MSAPRGASQSETCRRRAEMAEVLWMDGLSERRCASVNRRRHLVGPKGKRRTVVEWCGKRAEMAF